jgi:hypothetical protein
MRFAGRDYLCRRAWIFSEVLHAALLKVYEDSIANHRPVTDSLAS